MFYDLQYNWRLITEQIKVVRQSFDDFQSQAEPTIALFGAGVVGLEALAYFQEKKIKVDCFIDNSPQKQGTFIRGVPVVSAEDPLVKQATMVVITVKLAVNQISQQLNALNRSSIGFDVYYVLDNLDHYVYIRDQVLTDSRSIQTLDGILKAILFNSFSYCSEVFQDHHYFCFPHFIHTNEYFLDAGAYVGDTAERFIWASNGMFKHIYLFEPGLKQYRALELRMQRLMAEWLIESEQLSLLNMGLGESEGEALIASNLSVAANTTFKNIDILAPESSDTVKLTSLDTYFEQMNLPVTFIKSDIEGMEMALLRGGQKTLQRYKPKLALSAYHKMSDLYNMIDFVKQCVPDYNCALRHHSPILAETVLYFWCD